MRKERALRRAQCDKEAFIAKIEQAGSSLPESNRTVEIRELFVQKALARKAAAGDGRRSAPWPGRLVPVMAGFAIALIIAVATVVSAGFASVGAMPGSPLYSLKRTIQRARVSVSSGTDKVNALLTDANERMRELDYAKSRNLSEWLVPLIQDAREEIDEAVSEGRSIGGNEAVEVESEASQIVREHADEVKGSLQEASPGERKEIENWVEDETHEQQQQQKPGEGALPPRVDTPEQVNAGTERAITEEADRKEESHPPSTGKTTVEMGCAEPVQGSTTADGAGREAGSRSAEVKTSNTSEASKSKKESAGRPRREAAQAPHESSSKKAEQAE
jgi:hypothetical protein